MKLKNYGLPYKGSKSKIAEDIIKFLPSGNRLVDLFGGGFAISHCALLSNKWNSVYYNDIDPLLAPLIQKAINGEYSYDIFKPKFITREEFFEKKDTDGYVKWVWSFGNDGRSYMFGKDIEEYKRVAHNWVVFNECNELLNDFVLPNDRKLTETDIKARRLEFRKIVRLAKKRLDIQQLEQLQQLQQLQRLQQLQQLERLQQLQQLQRPSATLNTHCYTKYEHKEGDVVYCDIPYENTNKYSIPFNHSAFYEWVKTRPFPVYFSSYEIADNDFTYMWHKQKTVTMQGGSGNTATEYIYANKQGQSLIELNKTKEVKYEYSSIIL